MTAAGDPAPGTATRGEFERLVDEALAASYASGMANNTPESTTPEAAKAADDEAARTRAALLRYEERLRGTLAEVIRQADSDTQVRLWTGKCQVAEARAEEATARVRRLKKAVQALLACGSYGPEELDMARAALGVPTSAADEDGGAK